MGHSQSKHQRVAQSVPAAKRVIIHYRVPDELNVLGDKPTPNTLRVSHWCLQVGGRYYQLKDPEKRTYGCEELSEGKIFTYPDGSKRFPGKETDLLISGKYLGTGQATGWKSSEQAELNVTDSEIEKQARDIFYQGFHHEYGFTVENCQSFATFLYMATFLRDHGLVGAVGRLKTEYEMISAGAATLMAYVLYSATANTDLSMGNLDACWLQYIVLFFGPDDIDWSALKAPTNIQLINEAQLARMMRGSVFQQCQLSQQSLDRDRAGAGVQMWNPVDILNSQITFKDSAMQTMTFPDQSIPRSVLGVNS